MDEVGHKVRADLPLTLAQVSVEAVLEEDQRVRPDFVRGVAFELTRCGTKQLDQLRPIFLRDAHDVGDRVDRDGMRVLAGDLAPARADEALNEPVRKPMQVFFVGLHPFVGQQPGQERAVIDMLFSVETNKMGAPGQLVAMAFELLADIIAFGLKGQRRDGPYDRNDGGKRTVLAAENFGRLVIAGHHESALIPLAHDGALRAD